MMRLWLLIAELEALPGYVLVSCTDCSALIDLPGGRRRYFLD